MPSRRSLRLIVLTVSLIALGGCETAAVPMAEVTRAPAAASNIAVVAQPETQSSIGLPGDHAITKRYKVDITYPPLTPQEAPLADALRKTAAEAKQEFLQGLPDPKQFPEFADRQLQLLIDFKLAARTNAFVSVREQGMSDTGGAHPLPIDASFVYDIRAHRVIALDDLFSDPATARVKLADFAREALMKKLMTQAPKPGEGSPQAIREWKQNMRKMIDDGTQPTVANFSGFVVRAGSQKNMTGPGITLIFSPYQVAPYVFGTQTVDVPTRVFSAWLKPQYRNTFS